MAAPSSLVQKDRNLIAVIGDEDTCTGLLLAGIGQSDGRSKPNFMIVDNKTTVPQMEDCFGEFVKRKDIAIILINQHVANEIRNAVDDHDQAFPAVLEIPSKDHPYDPQKDSVLKKVQRLFGEEGQ